jgi:Fe-S oxidoreductase
MLTPIEKALFTLLAFGSLFAALQAADRIQRIIKRGGGEFKLDDVVRRAWDATLKFLTLAPTWRVRLGPSLMHALIAWGFTYYLLVNLTDGLRAFFGWEVPSLFGAFHRLIADVLSIGVLVGMTAMLVRRIVRGPKIFGFRETTLLHPKAVWGIRRDSLIVGFFILFHVGSRFLGESFHIAAPIAGTKFIVDPQLDAWQPFGSTIARLWLGFSPITVEVMEHIFFWGALGSILVFVPYFLYSKHIHIFMAPLNFLLKPERKSIGQLKAINFEDESITQYGAAKLEHLEWTALLDAYACIMCNRCQDACPANATGKALSPAALEINKRYFLNQEGAAIAAGKESSQGLLDFAISPEAVWACTTCGACSDICPVGNEPMRDILDIRRNLVLMENAFPAPFQTAFKGMERQANPWGIGAASRMEWAEGLNVPTVETNPDFEILYWVGCAPATDPRARKTARAFVKVLQAAGVNFAVLGKMESCTGDSARRSGNEALFMQLALQNVEVLNEVLAEEKLEQVHEAYRTVGEGLHVKDEERAVKHLRRIVATCPHCLHTLKNEYGDFGGHYDVVHHTQLINELTGAGKLKFDEKKALELAFHDPCYLGRHNGVLDEPREVLASAGAKVTELPRNRRQSFCCGAGGAQMWKEEEHGTERVNANRFAEAVATGKDTLAVACPFCLIMMSDAATNAKSEMQVRDVAEIVAESLLSTDGNG